MDKADRVTYVLYWPGRGWGEALILSMVTCILNDHGVEALFRQHGKTKGLLDCQLVDIENWPKNFKKISWFYDGIKREHNIPIMIQYMDYYSKLTGKEIKLTRDHVPVKFIELPNIPSTDVFMCTETGPYAPYRQWPYFDELKELLKASDISYVDMHKQKIWSMECLNYAKKCKLYLGLDTGVSHYVSKYANDKALIIQGGYLEFEYWSYPYRYDCIQVDVPCRPCFINRKHIAKGIQCQRDHECMRTIEPEVVLDRIKEKLNGK
ncbi:MAG: hypothetical protein ACXADW_10825 [Candidatus Hodarchaeales archaeon]|jgi:hypothetical protein